MIYRGVEEASYVVIWRKGELRRGISNCKGLVVGSECFRKSKEDCGVGVEGVGVRIE